MHELHLLNWAASVLWSSPPHGVLKFNVEGAIRGKPRPVEVGGILRISNDNIFLIFSKQVVPITSMKLRF